MENIRFKCGLFILKSAPFIYDMLCCKKDRERNINVGKKILNTISEQIC